MENGFQFSISFCLRGGGLLLFRLRSVLGRRTGNERRRPDPFARQTGARSRPMRADRRMRRSSMWCHRPVCRGDGLAALKAADPSFSDESFLTGARAAFEMIVKAFAAGDTAALQPLLSPDVYRRVL